ncbi:acid protease [Punctularia strigosozonata HHB-11173 SS5]|uniref:acid protease n=1 Tax=Punctularia strigosozonata (strain HHB-11173) TaxID=741275 RepID=UPI0004416824|nr:acid protease [Punctularia strigosozonata HHB-11173 SS5]EIN06447.1 acid protease [Punctularia strigosozonata HHB-11173 SS5]
MLVLPLCLLLVVVDAHRLSLTGHRRDPARAWTNRLGRRAALVGVSDLNDKSDVEYTTKLTLGGNEYNVVVDTGSSDLWVSGDVKKASDTGKGTTVTYAVGEVQGPIRLADMELAGYTTVQQAFIQVSTKSRPKGTGLLGLGPNVGSNIFYALGGASGVAPMDRIFMQNTSTPTYTTIMLGRSHGSSDTMPGEFTIGETVSGWDAIHSQPMLPVTIVDQASSAGYQHWQTTLDGIVGPGGSLITLNRSLTAAFDTGFTLSPVPDYVAEQIYSNVSQAKLETVHPYGEVWTLPCDVELNMTMQFGSVHIPIHPLDTNFDAGLKHKCIGAFQPITGNATADTGNWDMILGMSFLRNVYLLINYGNFIPCSTSPCLTRDDPYVQLMATTTNPSVVHDDFARARLHSHSLPLPIWAIVVVAIGVACLIAGAIVVARVIHRRKKQRTMAMIQLAPSDSKSRGAYSAVDGEIDGEIDGRPRRPETGHLRSASLGFDILGGETLSSRYSRYPSWSGADTTLRA